MNPGFLSILLSCFNPVHCIYLDYSGKFLNGLAFPPFLPRSSESAPGMTSSLQYGDMPFCFHQHFCSYSALCPSENQAIQTPYPPQMATFNLLVMSALKCHFSWQCLSHKFTEKNHRLQKTIPSGERFPSCSLNDPYS